MKDREREGRGTWKGGREGGQECHLNPISHDTSSVEKRERRGCWRRQTVSSSSMACEVDGAIIRWNAAAVWGSSRRAATVIVIDRRLLRRRRKVKWETLTFSRRHLFPIEDAVSLSSFSLAYRRRQAQTHTRGLNRLRSSPYPDLNIARVTSLLLVSETASDRRMLYF